MGNNVCTPCTDPSSDDYVVGVTDTPAIIELQSPRESSINDSNNTNLLYKNCNDIALIFANECSVPGKLQLDIQNQAIVIHINNKIHCLHLNEISHVLNKKSVHPLQTHEMKLLDNPTIVVLSLLPSGRALAIAFSCESEAKAFAKFIDDFKKS